VHRKLGFSAQHPDGNRRGRGAGRCGAAPPQTVQRGALARALRQAHCAATAIFQPAAVRTQVWVWRPARRPPRSVKFSAHAGDVIAVGGHDAAAGRRSLGVHGGSSTAPGAMASMRIAARPARSECVG